jgi:50S ribosomal subunit-associated GTPase HflX
VNSGEMRQSNDRKMIRERIKKLSQNLAEFEKQMEEYKRDFWTSVYQAIDD